MEMDVEEASLSGPKEAGKEAPGEDRSGEL